MTDVPAVPGDSSLAFLTEGYLFGHRRFERFGTDAFRTRLLGRTATILRGHDSARFFYEGERFSRDGAVPRSVLHSLQDEGSVQTLVGEAHRARKSLFTRLLDASGGERLVAAFGGAWDAAEATWRGTEISLQREVEHVLTDAVLDWLGIDASPEQRHDLAVETAAMIDGAGAFGPRNWRGRMLRQRSERWARGVVADARQQDLSPGSPLRQLVAHPDLAADDELAGVELLNLVRPTVAVARFIAFAALALHRHPEWRGRIATNPADAATFAQEVRRTTPFFPAIAGHAIADVSWRGIGFEAGAWVIVDLFATNRHPREWVNAWRFDPSRFESDDPDRVVAQGAGAIGATHRCPGEPATVDLIAEAAARLARLEWTVPDQNLRVDLSRLPARPGRAGLRMRMG